MYQFNDMFAIQPEAYYTMKGQLIKELEGFTYEAEMILDYIEIPLLLKSLFQLRILVLDLLFLLHLSDLTCR